MRTKFRVTGSRHSSLGALLYTAACDMVAAPSDSLGIATASQAWVYGQEQGATQMSGKSGVALFSFDSVWKLCFMSSCKLVKFVDKLI